MKRRVDFSPFWRAEDWWSVWLAAVIVFFSLTGLMGQAPRVGRWTHSVGAVMTTETVIGILALGLGFAALTAVAVGFTGGHVRSYLRGFIGVFGLSVIAYILGSQATMAHYGINNVIWALGLGLLVANVLGQPEWIKPAMQSGLFIKMGLVLLGAEILFHRVLSLGVYGLGVAWLVTPPVLYLMYVFGTRVLKISSTPLVATVAAATSVCGVSAAIAAGTATRATREEISYAISMSLVFTVIMMVLMPVICGWMGLSEVVSGAWIGGTVDSTGAVVAAGALVGPVAMEVAAVIKMIQNVLIGIVAFVLAMIWVSREGVSSGSTRPRMMEMWDRFPKFILGFVGASMLFSLVFTPLMGVEGVDQLVRVTSGFRGWLFCLAFTSIGLESNLGQMKKLMRSGSPLLLYVVGQSLNLVVTLIAAWLIFGGVLFAPPV